jgi:hypothetical protein
LKGKGKEPDGLNGIERNEEEGSVVSMELEDKTSENGIVGSSSSSLLEELEKRMNARIDKLEKEKEQEVKLLKDKLKEEGDKRSKLEEQFNKSEQEKKETELVEFNRLIILTQSQIDQVKQGFEERLSIVETNIQLWWQEKLQHLEHWWDSKMQLLASPNLAQIHLPVNPRNRPPPPPPPPPLSIATTSDPRRAPISSSLSTPSLPVSRTTTTTTNIPTGPSASRLPPHSSSSSASTRLPPPSQSVPNGSPNQSPRPHSPLEPTTNPPSTTSSTTSSSSSNNIEYVTLSKFTDTRVKVYKDLSSLEQKVWQELRKMNERVDEKVKKVIIDQQQRSNNLTASPVEFSPKKNGRPSPTPSEGEGDRAFKRQKTENGISSTSITLEEIQFREEARSKIAELESAVDILKDSLQTAQEEINKFSTNMNTTNNSRSLIETFEKRLLDKVEKDREELLKRMQDGDKSVGRKIDLDFKKTNETLTRLVINFGNLEKNVNKRLLGEQQPADVNNNNSAASSSSNQYHLTEQETEELKKKVLAIETDWKSIKEKLTEVAGRVSYDSPSNHRLESHLLTFAGSCI